METWGKRVSAAFRLDDATLAVSAAEGVRAAVGYRCC